MNYPDKIYSKFEIVEKDIYGKKHYGLIKHYNVLGFTFKRHMKVWEGLFGNGSLHVGGGAKWHSNRSTITSAVDRDQQHREYKFRKKVTK